jgi:hypothetical protein
MQKKVREADVFLSRIHSRPIYSKFAYLINRLKDTDRIVFGKPVSENFIFGEEINSQETAFLTPSQWKINKNKISVVAVLLSTCLL